MDCFLDPCDDALPLTVLRADGLSAWLDGAGAAHRAWVTSMGFAARAGQTLVLPGPLGEPAGALVGIGDGSDVLAAGAAASDLPALAWRHEPEGSPLRSDDLCLAFGCGAYRFSRYKKADPSPGAKLVWPEATDRAAVLRMVAAISLVRDLVNTPAADMGPGELEDAARRLAVTHGAEVRTVEGSALVEEGFPAIHAVGRAAEQAPRLIELTWGDPAKPRLALVGKGVCFDTGGLDIKPSSAMLLMKKDMGGAAHALGLAALVMGAGLPVHLQVLIPAVENAIGPAAMRPGDVLNTRTGTTVEVTNTDAEGRLVLADALALACEGEPDLVIDFATLTGAARVALGPDIPALFCNDDPLAAQIARAAQNRGDPLWRLPLFAGYRDALKSAVADMNNAPSGSFAGAIHAALFLEAFVTPATPWVHVDVYAWTPSARPGRPKGGEAMGLRALFQVILDRYLA